MLLKIGFVVAVLSCIALSGYAQTSIKVGNGPGHRTTITYDDSLPGIKLDNDDDGDIDMSFTGAGQIRFQGALMPNNSAGNSGDLLRSNGSSSYPSWVNLNSVLWGTTGNAGTGSSNFLGTTDNNPLAIRTNNVERFHVNGTSASPDSGAIVPTTDNTYSLGTSANRWRDLYLGPSSIRMGGFISGAKGAQQEQTVDEVTISYEDGSLVIDKDILQGGDLVPSVDDIFNIGTSDNRWHDLYIGENSLHIGTSAAEATMTYNDATASLEFNTDGVGAPEITLSGSGGIGKIGIGTVAPVTSLDVNGDASFRFSGLSLANGANTGVAVAGSSALRITGPTASFEIHGIADGQDGKVIELYNASGQTMRLFNQSATEATAANRIITGTGHSFEVRNLCAVQLVYNSTDGRWVMTSGTRNTSNAVYSMKTYASFGAVSQTAWTPDYGYICHRVSSSANISISGINSTGVQDGTMIVLLNAGTSNIALQNENANAGSATYRIITGTGNNETLAPNKPASLIYDGTSQRWRMISGR